MSDRDPQLSGLSTLAARGKLDAGTIDAAAADAAARGVPLARVLHQEYGLPRQDLIEALAAHYQCQAIEYDERLPIPPELLLAVSGKQLAVRGWFPVIKDLVDGGVVVAAVDPSDPELHAEVEETLGPGRYEYRVALPDDIQWYIQDFLHARPGKLVGTERTGHAFWRNTMAQWRTRLACYRTDMAKARTALASVRDGLAFTTIADTLMRSPQFHVPMPLALAVLAVGLALIANGLPIYLRVRKSRMTPPRDQTLVEVTAATLHFLEAYHFIEHDGGEPTPTKATMLARIGDLLGNYCTILWPEPGSQERTHLARERNVLAAQRTIGGCYRTLYARGRTGLAFVRTGVSFASIGIGLIQYFGLSFNTPFDVMLVVIGLLLVWDGLLWYWPVRKEQAELPRTRSAALA